MKIQTRLAALCAATLAACFSATPPAAFCTSDLNCADGTHCDTTAQACVAGVVVTVSPGTQTIGIGGSASIAATVSGTTTTTVHWTLQEPGGGTLLAIGASVDFVSSGTTGTFHVTATADADKSATATASVTVNPLSITPTSASLNVHHTQQFSTNGAGGAWSVQEPTGGTITSAGLYTAPAAAGTFHVSYGTGQFSATATVTVLDAVAVTVMPATATIFSSASFQFNATAANAGSNTAVTWSVPGVNAGSINRTTGLYTAPEAAGSSKVIATSAADPTASGSAKITVVAAPVITVTPTSASVVEGGKQQFTVAIANPPNGDMSVLWSVQETGGGTVGSNGNYTAPVAAGTYHVIASCASAAAYTGTATITVGPLQITPATANVQRGKTQQFTANSPGTWSVQESGGGTIDAAGLYTPPASLSSGTFHVILTATAGGTATATVTLVPAIVVTIGPTTATLFSGQTQQFSASVMNASTTTVTWSLAEGPASVAGTVSSSGLYTAGAAGAVHLFAKASADPTSSAIAVITVNAVPKVTISPASPLVVIGKAAQLTATVSNPPGGNTAITWSVMESGGPSIDANGLVTSGSTAGTYHVTATLTSAPGYSATVQLRVTSGPTATNSILSIPTTAAHSDGQSTITVTVTVKDSSGSALPGATVVFPQVSGVSFTAQPNNSAAWMSGALANASGVTLPQSGFVGIANSTGSFTIFVSSLTAAPMISALLCTSLPCPANAPVLSGSLDFHLVSWQSASGGLAGADVNGLVAGPDSNGASILYLSTNDGVHASTNQGASWTARNAGMEGVPVGPVSVGAAKVLYTVAAQQKRTTTQGISGLFFSVDSGATWTLRQAPNDFLQTMAADPNTPGRLIAGGYTALYQSVDQGLNWTAMLPINNGSRNTRFVFYDTVKTGLAYAAGVVYTGSTPAPYIAGTTDGTTWKDLGAVVVGGTTFPCAQNINGFAEDSSGAFYLACSDGSLYLSSDAVSWTLQSQFNSGTLFVGADRNLYLSWGNSISESNDGGKTFGSVQPGSLPFNVSGIVVDPNSAALYVAGHGTTLGESSGFGIISSGNLTISNSGLTSPSPLYGSVMATDSSGIAVQFLNGKVWRSLDGGANWALNSTGLPTFQFGTGVSMQVDATGAASNNAVSTAATYLLNGGTLYRARGTSSSWSATASTPASGLGTLAADAVTSGTVYSLSYDNVHLSYSTDYGDKWTTLTTPMHSLGIIHLQAVRSPQTQLNVLYFSLSQQQVSQSPGGLYKSTDRGTTWTEIHTQTLTTPDYNGYIPSSFDDKTFFFDTNGAPSLTVDNFTNSTQLLVGGRLCGVDPVQQGSVYIFQNFGGGRFNFVRSPNNGQSAASADVGIGVLTQSQLDLAFFPAAGQILAHARGRGFLRTTTSGQ